MPDQNPVKKTSFITRDSRISSRTTIPSLGTIVSIVAIIFLIYAFFSGLSFQFYASFVFLFYGLTKSMWISVVLLGVFQTLLMIPFRMIRVVMDKNIREFQRTVEKIKDNSQQSFTLKSTFRQGNATFLFYAVDFIMQLVSYISIGRLFLTDFYTNQLNRDLLYSWVPYPNYPIQDTFFKIPYPHVTETVDLGWKVVIPVWIVLTIVQIAILAARRTIREQHGSEAAQQLFSGRWSRYATGSLLIFLAIAYWIVRNFPVGIQVGIFSGDVSIPNRTFNTITAIVTFLVLVYHGIPKIIRKGQLAERLKIPTRIISTTQMEMLKETLFSALMVGLGAFFITNQIPSAFELSIFTLEMISLAAPFTVDKIVLKGVNVTQEEEESAADIFHQFGHEEPIEEPKPVEEKPTEKVEEKTPEKPPAETKTHAG